MIAMLWRFLGLVLLLRVVLSLVRALAAPASRRRPVPDAPPTPPRRHATIRDEVIDAEFEDLSDAER